MHRKDFIKTSAALGIGLPLMSLFFESCNSETPSFEVNFSGKVLIIGAGAAGLTAGYLLKQNNIDFQIIEANPIYGGRIKRDKTLADFPIDIGAEWIHTDTTVLSEILGDSSINTKTDFIKYSPKSIYNWKDGELKKQSWVSSIYSEYKFKNTTWFGFFETFIIPKIANNIVLNQPVSSINYGGDKVAVTTLDRSVFSCDKVLVTVPISMLKAGAINFTPDLPAEKRVAFKQVEFGAGLKAFIEFRERFYPDMVFMGDIIDSLSSPTKIYYDVAFGKNSTKNICGLFTIGNKAERYTALPTDEAIIREILGELDEMFDGKASSNYVQHVIQNWSKEPYIQGSYSYGFDGNRKAIIRTITKPLNDKVYFAGEALSIDNQATVHGAAESAYVVMEEILK